MPKMNKNSALSLIIIIIIVEWDVFSLSRVFTEMVKFL